MLCFRRFGTVLQDKTPSKMDGNFNDKSRACHVYATLIFMAHRQHLGVRICSAKHGNGSHWPTYI